MITKREPSDIRQLPLYLMSYYKKKKTVLHMMQNGS